MNNIKVLILGYYGQGDAGDEAILSCLSKKIKENFNADITVVSGDVEYTKKEHNLHAVRSVFGGNIFSKTLNYINLIDKIRNYDVFVLGGGGLISELFGRKSRKKTLFYLSLLRRAKLLGKKTIVYSIGVSEIKTKKFARKIKEGLEYADIISVRDKKSKKILEEIGIKKEINILPDPAFLLAPEEDEKIIEEENIGRKKIIGIALTDFIKPYMNSFARSIDKMIEKYDAEVVLITTAGRPGEIKAGVEKKMMEKIRNKSNVRIIKRYPPRKLLWLLSKFDLVISMRLHMLIFSAISGVPFIGIPSDEKIKNFLEIIKQEEYSAMPEEDEKIEKLAENSINNKKRKREIRKKYLELKKEIENNFQKVFDVRNLFLEINNWKTYKNAAIVKDDDYFPFMSLPAMENQIKLWKMFKEKNVPLLMAIVPLGASVFVFDKNENMPDTNTITINKNKIEKVLNENKKLRIDAGFRDKVYLGLDANFTEQFFPEYLKTIKLLIKKYGFNVCMHGVEHRQRASSLHTKDFDEFAGLDKEGIKKKLKSGIRFMNKNFSGWDRSFVDAFGTSPPRLKEALAELGLIQFPSARWAETKLTKNEFGGYELGCMHAYDVEEVKRYWNKSLKENGIFVLSLHSFLGEEKIYSSFSAASWFLKNLKETWVTTPRKLVEYFESRKKVYNSIFIKQENKTEISFYIPKNDEFLFKVRKARIKTSGRIIKEDEKFCYILFKKKGKHKINITWQKN